jgi:insulysin
MRLPFPRELLLSAPYLSWEWDLEGVAEDTNARHLESLRITEGRVVLMAPEVDQDKLQLQAKWEREPWYGTQYRVEQFDKGFIHKV